LYYQNYFILRWGQIQCATPIRDIKTGEELLVHYGYKKTKFPDDNLWYWEFKKALEIEENQKIMDEMKKVNHRDDL